MYTIVVIGGRLCTSYRWTMLPAGLSLMYMCTYIYVSVQMTRNLMHNECRSYLHYSQGC